jgi:hypothetical protein
MWFFSNLTSGGAIKRDAREMRAANWTILDTDGGHRDKVSVIGGISVSPTAQRLGLYFATDPEGFFTADHTSLEVTLLAHSPRDPRPATRPC